MKIGELAKAAQCTVETVRYYEKAGLLASPVRTTANYRSYARSHLERLCFIRNCRALGMAQEEIHSLLELLDQPTGNCSDVSGLLDRHIQHVDGRIQELLQLKQQLAELRQQCRNEENIGACGIIHGLAVMGPDGPERQSHLVHGVSDSPRNTGRV